jgi:GNAT superfamily N-acetyltransferase
VNATEISLAAELSEVAAWKSLMDLLPQETRAMLQADCREVGGGLAICARSVPLVTFNRAIGLGLIATAEPVALRVHLAAMAAPVVQVQVAKVNAVSDEALSAAGFVRSPLVWAKMARPTEGVVPDRAGFDPVLATAGTAAEFARIVTQGFGMPQFFAPWLAAMVSAPDWRCYIAGGKAGYVAAGALHLGPQGAWLGIAATVPEARGQGAQKALIRHRLAEAAGLGLAMAYTETAVLPGPNPSLGNMKACGFGLAHERQNWVLA